MPVNISAKAEQELIPMFVKRLEDAENYYDTRFKIAKEHYKNYNSIRSKRFYNGRSDIFVPLSFMVVETLVARIMRIIYAEPVLVSLEGVGPSDKDREERIRALMQMQQKKLVKLWPKLLDYWRGKAMYGRAYAKMEWRTDYRTVTKTEAVTGKGKKIDNLTEFRKSPEERDPEGARELELVSELESQLGVAPPEQDEVRDTTFPIEEGGVNDDRRVKVKTKEVRVASYDCWDFVPLDFFDVLVDPMAPNGDIQRASWASIRSLMADEETSKILRIAASLVASAPRP